VSLVWPFLTGRDADEVVDIPAKRARCIVKTSTPVLWAPLGRGSASLRQIAAPVNSA
jgi:hypothetical protein